MQRIYALDAMNTGQAALTWLSPGKKVVDSATWANIIVAVA